jgi:hypothetical protein
MATASTRPKGTKINLDKCWNTDPITLEDLTDKSVDETIMIPSSHEKKKNHAHGIGRSIRNNNYEIINESLVFL